MLAGPIIIGAILLAVVLNSVFWLVALAALLVLAATLLTALARAIRPAMRPQHVKYDHSWLTNVLGGTSTPHPGRAAAEPRRPSSNPDGSSDAG
jgi:hypothetical protein